MDDFNPFRKSKTNKENNYCIFFFNLLYNKALSIYKWSGDPFSGVNPDIDSEYVERILLKEGFAGAFLDSNNKIRILETSKIGYNPYALPDKLLSVNPVLGTLSGTVGNNCVYIRSNKSSTSAIQIISHFAKMLAKLQLSLDISLNNNRMTKIFTATDDPEANQIRKMQDDVSDGKPAIIIKKSILSSIMDSRDMLPVYGTPETYLATSYIQDMRSVINDFYTTFGVNVNGANIVKKERNLESEVLSNKQEIMINREFWLSTRVKAAEQINEMFGTNISVGIVGDEYDI